MWPGAIFIQSRGETGLETLIDAGRLKETPHFPAAETWAEIVGYVRQLRNEAHEYKTLVLDTINGAERLMHESVCSEKFGGDWGERGFTSYGKGFEQSLPEWITLLSELDALRAEKRMRIILLCHTKVKNFKNPQGADYDRYQPDIHEKTWSVTHKWADVVLFGNFESFIQGGRVDDTDSRKNQKGKALDSAPVRIIYTERRTSFDAKNRLGLPAEIALSDTPEAGFQDFINAVRTATTKEKA